MHDVIRDMCLWIACECEEEKWKWRFFVQASSGLTMLPEVGKWKSTHRMSLMDNMIVNLVETPNCPHLQTLFLNRNWLKVINNDFFQFMCGLKVLDLSWNSNIEELPVGISKLVSLEYLDLSWTKIRQLPIELMALEKLKCLNLESSTIRIPSQLISGLLKLQVLRMRGCYYLEQEVEDNSESLVEELKCLNHLNVLTVTLSNALGLDRFLSDERLCSSTVHIELKLVDDSKSLNIVSLANIKCLNDLYLMDCNSLEEVKMEGRMIKAESRIQIQISVIATQHCFQSLRGVLICRCSKLIDTTWLILAPNLMHLCVYHCNNMEEIINERKVSQVVEQVETSSLFAKLEYLQLVNLPELKSIYGETLPLPFLQDIYVYGCPELKRLPLNSNSAKDKKISIHGDEGWWKELQWDDESTQNQFLPCFKPGR